MFVVANEVASQPAGRGDATALQDDGQLETLRRHAKYREGGGVVVDADLTE